MHSPAAADLAPAECPHQAADRCRWVERELHREVGSSHGGTQVVGTSAGSGGTRAADMGNVDTLVAGIGLAQQAGTARTCRLVGILGTRAAPGAYLAPVPVGHVGAAVAHGAGEVRVAVHGGAQAEGRAVAHVGALVAADAPAEAGHDADAHGAVACAGAHVGAPACWAAHGAEGCLEASHAGAGSRAEQAAPLRCS